jgi:hypothetical protein
MNWPIEKIGAQAIIFPNQKEHARAAIQSLSEVPSTKYLFKHIGWREIGGQWVYLHAGGAINAYGTDTSVAVKLDGTLGQYEVQLPPRAGRIEAIRASLGLLELMPQAMYPLLAATYRAALKPCDFLVHIAGPSGVFKTAVAALLQQHFGPSMNERNLPGSWSSTANALEVMAFQAKDSLLTVDDFAPKGNQQEVSRLHSVAERIIRATGNHSARSRLGVGAVLQESKPPRGLIVSTGEDIPFGHSIRARLLTLEMGKGDVNVKTLSQCQVYGNRGLLSQSMASGSSRIVC